MLLEKIKIWFQLTASTSSFLSFLEFHVIAKNMNLINFIALVLIESLFSSRLGTKRFSKFISFATI